MHDDHISTMSERDFANVLSEALIEYGIDRVDSFESSGLLTSNTGLIVRIGESEFQLTIVQSA